MLEALDRLIDGLKTVRDVARRMHYAELLSAIANLTLDSVQLKADAASIREENTRLREELQRLLERVEVRSKVAIRNGMYYATETIKGYSQGPFCTRCLDSAGKLITLMGPGWQPNRRGGIGTFQAPDNTAWTCPECIRAIG